MSCYKTSWPDRSPIRLDWGTAWCGITSLKAYKAALAAGKVGTGRVTRTGDWQEKGGRLKYWCVNGGPWRGCWKNLVLVVECVGKAGLKSPAFLFAQRLLLQDGVRADDYGLGAPPPPPPPVPGTPPPPEPPVRGAKSGLPQAAPLFVELLQCEDHRKARNYGMIRAR